MHNQKRNQIAAGRLARYSSAIRMGTMQWSRELAYLASLNVRQCTMRHDSCSNTYRFRYAGQNLAMMWSSGGPQLNVLRFLTTSINDWWNEHIYANMDFINSYPSNYNGP